MPYKPIPSGSILDSKEYYGVRSGRKVWASKDRSRFYTWDRQHGEVEVFDRQGYHLGSLDPMTGVKMKDAVRGRRLNVS